MPVKDTHQVGIGITNPYGRTKFILEEMLKDLSVSDEKWKITMLRYKTFKNSILPYILYIRVGFGMACSKNPEIPGVGIGILTSLKNPEKIPSAIISKIPKSRGSGSEFENLE